MHLAIISSNETHRDTLLKALSYPSIEISSYSKIDDIPLKNAIDIALYYIPDDHIERTIEFAKSIPCFGILDTKSEIKRKIEPACLNIFDAPVRLGSIKKSIQLYLEQREQKNSLKPIHMGKFILDPRNNNFGCDEEGTSIRLTEKEQDILLYLNSCQGQSVGRQQLLDNVWGYAQGVETHTLETHIYRLRQKIEIDPTAPQFLVTNDDGYYLNF